MGENKREKQKHPHTQYSNIGNFSKFVLELSIKVTNFYFRYVTIVIDLTSAPSTDGEDGSVFNPQMLRTFRVLRALKTVSIVPGMVLM